MQPVYKLERLVSDQGLRRVLRSALSDGKLSDGEIHEMIMFSHSDKRVTEAELQAMRAILNNSKSISSTARLMLKDFLTCNAKEAMPVLGSSDGESKDKLTENFSISEFRCKDGSEVPASLRINAQKLADNLQVLRTALGSAILINCAYRTTKHNKKVGGVSNSQHLYCKAADIRTRKHTPKEIRSKILKLIKDGKMSEGGLGLYNTFVHYDVRGTEARWDFSKKA